ncbi:MAG TPA: long-chain fatty acid--CoA ligase [Candidatus Limnocylindria bacterium]|nr:long-chain fatty acid--CoA ligase [Candidatus Limnocylindria bacterium]
MSHVAALEAAIRAWADGGVFEGFEEWALRAFAHQFERVAAYRSYCERRGVTPATVASWTDVPAVPAAAFRHADLATGPAEAAFRTSGTTGGAGARGRHPIVHLSLYRASALAGFRHFVVPDDERLACLFLLPPLAARPDSSLVHMCAWVGEAFGTSVEWFVGDEGLDLARLRERLAALAASGEPVLLAGPTAAFVRLFDTGFSCRLGPGSRVMDTGGAKGMPRPLSRPGFLRACWTHLGIAGYFCVNEYGMTELCSQRYDSVLADRMAGRSLAARRLVAPPWLRTRVLDPDTLTPVAPGATGLLCHHDLANWGSVSVVLTEDLGHATGGDGIVVEGRVSGAPPRGCGQLLVAMSP